MGRRQIPRTGAQARSVFLEHVLRWTAQAMPEAAPDVLSRLVRAAARPRDLTPRAAQLAADGFAASDAAPHDAPQRFGMEQRGGFDRRALERGSVDRRALEGRGDSSSALLRRPTRPRWRRGAERLLFVTEKFPYPLDDGGQIRTFHVLKSLAAEFPVTLIGLEPPALEHVAPIRELGVDVRLVGQRASRRALPYYVAQAAFTREPYPLRKNFSRAMLDTLDAEIATGQVGFVHFNQIDAVQYVERMRPPPYPLRTVFDTLNVLSTMYERLFETAGDPLRRAYCWMQWRKMLRYEPQIMRRVDRVLVCSDVEREFVGTLGIDHALLVPNGVDTQAFLPRGRAPRSSAKLRVVFTGGMDYLPNQDGVRWFVNDMVPELDRRELEFDLTVVGKNPPASLTALARPDRIAFTGRVDDVRPYTASADVFVVPLRIGGGTRLKILEALSMGVPVVSTRVGAEGIALTPDQHILLADTPAEFASAIERLARSPELRARLGAAGRALVLERYDWSRVTSSLIDFYRAL